MSNPRIPATAAFAILLVGCSGGAKIEPPELTFSALEVEPGLVNYALILTNRSDELLRDLEVVLAAPVGTEPDMVLTIPQGSVLVDSGPRRVVWSLAELYPHRQVGPFACRASVTEPNMQGDARAVVRWSLPSGGEVMAELSGWGSVRDATAMQVIPPHGPSGLTAIDGTGIRYHASPDLGGASLFIRPETPGTTFDLPAVDEITWVSAAELSVVGADISGRIVIVLPSSLPLRPYSTAQVWGEKEGAWERLCGSAQVTPDGQYLALTPVSAGRIAIGVRRGTVENPASMSLPTHSDALAIWDDFTPVSSRRVNPAGGAETMWGTEPIECGAPFCLATDGDARPLSPDVMLPGVFRSQPANSVLWLLSVEAIPNGSTCPGARIDEVELGWSVGVAPDGKLILVLAATNARPTFGSPDGARATDEMPSPSGPLDFTWRILAAHRTDEGWMARVRIEPIGGIGFYTCLGPDGSPCGLEEGGYYIDVESRSACEPWVGGVSVISGEDRVDRTLQIDPGFCPR